MLEWPVISCNLGKFALERLVLKLGIIQSNPAKINLTAHRQSRNPRQEKDEEYQGIKNSSPLRNQRENLWC